MKHSPGSPFLRLLLVIVGVLTFVVAPLPASAQGSGEMPPGFQNGQGDFGGGDFGPGGGGSSGGNGSDMQINTESINRLSNGLAFYALIACVVGICVSASLWALGNKGQNPGTELTGKRGLILCCTAAFFVGALPGMVGWLDREAQRVDTTGVTNSNGETTFQVGGNTFRSGGGDFGP